MNQQSFRLSLANTQQWHIIGKGQQASLVQDLAQLLCLQPSKPGEQDLKLIFADRKHTDLFRDHPLMFADRFGRVRIWWRQGATDAYVEVRRAHTEEDRYHVMKTGLQMIRHVNILHGGVSLHAALVTFNGQGVLFAAPSGIGKTTCSRRLPDHWTTLCDDEVVLTRMHDTHYYAHPFPTWSEYLWQLSEKTWDVQHSVPLSGIFFIEQAEQDDVEPIGEGQAATQISMSAMQICMKFWRKWDKDTQRAFRQEIFVNACEIAKTVPVFRLRVSLHGRFWEKMEQAFLSGK